VDSDIGDGGSSFAQIYKVEEDKFDIDLKFLTVEPANDTYTCHWSCTFDLTSSIKVLTRWYHVLNNKYYGNPNLIHSYVGLIPLG
jgi:hypothetical protein